MRRTVEEGFEPQTPEFQAKRQELKDQIAQTIKPIIDEMTRLRQVIETMVVSEEAATNQNTDVIRGGRVDQRRLNKTPTELKKIDLIARLEELQALLDQLSARLEDTAMDIWKSEKR